MRLLIGAHTQPREFLPQLRMKKRIWNCMRELKYQSVVLNVANFKSIVLKLMLQFIFKGLIVLRLVL